MKTMRYKKLTIFSLACLLIASCDSFLDEMPDNRTEIDTDQKVAELLISAYPTVDPMMIYEHRTDNVQDNGKQYGNSDRTIQENYYWEDISDVAWDSPEQLWNSCYRAVATTNEALDAIAVLGESSRNRASKGEALLCRAYAHFLLVNTFCKPYSESTSGTDIGIPYVKMRETVIGTTYDRGTVKGVYEAIASDIEEGFPLLNDDVYAVPLYHFTQKAAAAFAARFYLFYGNYNKSLEYANKAIAADPSSTLRDLSQYQVLASSSEWRDRFISKNEVANLLLVPLRSLWGRNYTTQRFGNSNAMTNYNTYRSKGPWGNVLGLFDLLFGVSGYPVKFQPKYNEIFEYTNRTAGIGQPHVVQMAFTTDETLMCRAEAKVMLGLYDEAAQDLSYWYVKKGGAAATADQIVDYYTTRQSEDEAKIASGDLDAIYRLVKPFNASFAIEAGKQEMMLQAVLHARRIETIYSGLRWLDIRRYGIEVIHNRDEQDPIVLVSGDLRRSIQLPQSVISAGLPANPK